ncbi:MAG: methionine biosynthesis protein MetW [Kiritimatiellae bacterium]|nr:methionine biosynthesis protein MetW [Kiritimatiellia bacterium]
MTSGVERRGRRPVPAVRCRRCAEAERVLCWLDPALQAASGRGDLVDRYRRYVTRRVATSPGRWQDPIIVRTIPRGASVLDLGCGSGELLAALMRQRAVRAQGIELDAAEVMRCIERGVPVFQCDLDQGLAGFADRAFDFVVLEETLQTLHRPLTVLREMLRVGRQGIVSFPNFAWWRVRLSLMLEGRMPETERLPYRWYDTPNIHLFTLRDFLEWAAREGVEILSGYACANGTVRPMRDDDNLEAEEALLFLRKSRKRVGQR